MADNANNSTSSPINGGNDNYTAVPVAEVAAIKRKMVGAFTRFTTASDRRIDYAQKLRQKGETTDSEFKKFTDTQMLNFRAGYNEATYEAGVAKADYRLYKKQYSTAMAQNQKLRRISLRDKRSETSMLVSIPQLKKETFTALDKAYNEVGLREIIDSLKALAQFEKRIEFREKFDQHMPKLDEKLFNRVSLVPQVKTEVLMAAMVFLRSMPEQVEGAGTGASTAGETK
jgi:hypothetical protein